MFGPDYTAPTSRSSEWSLVLQFPSVRPLPFPCPSPPGAGGGFLSIFYPNPSPGSALVCRGTACPAPASIVDLVPLGTGPCTCGEVSPASPAPPSDLLDPRPQVWGALIEADSLDEVLLTGWHHQPTVKQAEVVEQGHIQVGMPTGTGCAAGLLCPGDALRG